MKYVIGVDGGGTKTNYAIFDLNTNLIVTEKWGPTNHEHMDNGFCDLEKELNMMINTMLRNSGIRKNDIASAVFGMAGVDTRKQHEKISDIITNTGIGSFLLCNDAYLGVKAGCEDGVGISVANGTGCTVAGIDKNLRMMKIGGMGELTGDIAGGYFLGRKVISTVYGELFKGYPKTIMTDMIFSMLGIKSKHDYIDKIIEKLEEKDFNIKDLNKVLFKAANMGDSPSIMILKEMGKDNARAVNTILNDMLFGEEVTVVLNGSIYIKGENLIAEKSLKNEVAKKNENKKINFKKLHGPSVAGAIIWALNRLGIRSICEKVIQSF